MSDSQLHRAGPPGNGLKLLFGPPGTGKTTRALNIVEQELAAGIPPGRIAFVSFTRKAVREAQERAMAKFKLAKESLPYFKTLHSLCYSELDLSENEVIGTKQYKELGGLLGVTFSGVYEEDEGLPIGRNPGDRLLFVENLARARCVSLEQQYQELNDPLEWFTLKQFADVFTKYKRDLALLDFTDMLNEYITQGAPLDVDVAVIDEAQDLSVLQWRVARHALQRAKRIYIAGDDDQAIYRWSGADVEQFMRLEGEREILSQSYRLPEQVHTLARGIISRVKQRVEKQFNPRSAPGGVLRITSPDFIDLTLPGSYLMLARNCYQLDRFSMVVREHGYTYTTHKGSSVVKEHIDAIRDWERLRKGESITGAEVKIVYDQLRIGIGIQRGFKSGKGLVDDQYYNIGTLQKDHGLLIDVPWYEALLMIPEPDRLYYRNVLRSGRKLTAAPYIHISTIHRAKGGEAENVVLLTDMSSRTFEEYSRGQDDEHRIAYVGVTRAKETLQIIQPQTLRSYPM